MTSAREPIGPAERDRLLEPLAEFYAVVLAVSGGPDSTALMHFVAAWRSEGGPSRRPKVHVATVNHRMQTGSEAVAAGVVAEAERLDLPAVVLTWDGAPISGQEDARKVRYALLEAFVHRCCSANGRGALVVAHTLDDQAETVLMRLARGSGLDGLAGMAERSCRNEATILRPLLSVPKQRLLASLTAVGARWLEDPANTCLDYERARWRVAQPALESVGLTSEVIARSARRLARSRATLERLVDARVADWLHTPPQSAIAPFGVACGVGEGAANDDIALRHLIFAIATVGGLARRELSLSKVEALADRLARDHQEGFDGATLGRSVIRRLPVGAIGSLAAWCSGDEDLSAAKGASNDVDGAGETEQMLLVIRETKRNPLPALVLAPGETALWDNRFKVGLAADASAPVRVAGVDQATRARIKAMAREAGHLWPSLGGLVDDIVAGLPAFWRGDRLIGVPSLDGICPFSCHLAADGVSCAEADVAVEGPAADARLPTSVTASFVWPVRPS